MQLFFILFSNLEKRIHFVAVKYYYLGQLGMQI